MAFQNTSEQATPSPVVANAPAASRPVSASGIWTGPIGLAAGVASLFVLHGLQAPSYVKTLAVMAAVGLAMLAVDVLVYRKLVTSHVGQIRANWHRIGQKLVSLYVIFAVIGATYWILPLYQDDYYKPFRDALLVCVPVLALLSPVYVALTDARMAEPDDAYVDLAKLISGQRPQDWSSLLNLSRGWLVKAFFLPLMFVFVNSDLNQIWAMQEFPAMPNFEAAFGHVYDLLYLFDVMLAAVGYVATLKLLDTQIRSAEPTLWGWLVCLICYPPFWSGVGQQYLSYDQDNTYWGQLMSGTPWLYTVWGGAILVLVAIYVWATVAFGLRFSNLTHRGIITHGPYRWVKHPAYLSKNITWWMISVPFIAGTGDWSMALRSSLLLAGVNLIYFLRAVTEERHLSRDPVYRQYQAYIAEHGLFANIGRRLGLRRPGLVVIAGKD